MTNLPSTNFIEITTSKIIKKLYKKYVYLDSKTKNIEELKLCNLVPRSYRIKYLGSFNKDDNRSCQPHMIRVPKKYCAELEKEIFPKLHKNLMIVYDDYLYLYREFNDALRSIINEKLI